MKYRPDIDGLRAIAVLSVLFYHAHLGFPGGYVGVDVFFVISGFLITGLLQREISKGTFSYLSFYERRIRRLIPALAVVLLFTALTSAIFLLPPHLKDLGRSLISQPLMLSNVYFWRVVKQGYFGEPPEIRPLLHTWSLGVEEQFYLFYPLLLVAVLKRNKLAPHLVKILGGIVLLSLALSTLLTPIKSVLSFFTLPTRAWELLLGGLLALKLAASPNGQQAWSRAPRELSSVFGLGLIAYATFFFSHKTPFPGSTALFPCLGTALIIWSNSTASQTFLGRLLSKPPVVLIGQISYSLYLWHWPLIAYGDYFFLLKSTEAKLAVVLVSCWLGYASWRWIETPFRKKRYLATKKAAFTMFALYALVCLSLGLCCYVLALKSEKSSVYIPTPTRSGIYEYRFNDQPAPLLQLGKIYPSPPPPPPPISTMG